MLIGNQSFNRIQYRNTNVYLKKDNKYNKNWLVCVYFIWKTFLVIAGKLGRNVSHACMYSIIITMDFLPYNTLTPASLVLIFLDGASMH